MRLEDYQDTNVASQIAWHDLQCYAAYITNEADASQLEADIPMQQAAKSLCSLLVHRVGNESKKCIVDDYTTGLHEYLRA